MCVNASETPFKGPKIYDSMCLKIKKKSDLTGFKNLLGLYI